MTLGQERNWSNAGSATVSSENWEEPRSSLSPCREGEDLFISEWYRKDAGTEDVLCGQEGWEDQNSEWARMPLTSVNHKNDGVLRDAHAQGHLPELQQKAVPQLWLPACK